VRYRAFGATRFTSGTTPTSVRFTGQREEAALGLYFYNARRYDPALGHFLSPDTVVPEPGNALDYHRYAYVRFNPLKYTDPSGHWLETVWDIANIAWDIDEIRQDPGNLWNWGALVVDVGAALLPVVPAGAGMVVHGGKAAKAAVEAASHADEAVDAARMAGRLGEAVDAITAARRLQEVGVHADEAGDLIKAIAHQSTRGSGERVVIGKWVEGGGYIAEAQKHGGIYFATEPGVWEALGKNPELAWAVNEQFLRSQLEAGVSRIELVGETIEQVEKYAVGTFRWREIQFLKEHAAQYGYELVGNIWVKVR
jgi:RHS repeat-associated protein